MEEKIEMLKIRQLDENYIIIYSFMNEVKYVTKDHKVIPKKLYTLIGINNKGERTVLDIVIENIQDHHFWLDTFERLKSRGIKNILFISITNNQNIERAIRISYPNTIITPSLTDIITSTYKYITVRGRNHLIAQIKSLCLKEDLSSFKEHLTLFKRAFNDNIIISTLIDKKIKEIEPFYKYDIEIRKLLFNHNQYTEMYDCIKKYSLDNLVSNKNELWNYLYDKMIYFEKYKSYTKRGWTEILNHIVMIFPNYLEKLMEEIG